MSLITTVLRICRGLRHARGCLGVRLTVSLLTQAPVRLVTKGELRALEERMHSHVDSAVSTTISAALARQTRMLMVTMAGCMPTNWVPLT